MISWISMRFTPLVTMRTLRHFRYGLVRPRRGGDLPKVTLQCVRGRARTGNLRALALT